jgi:Leucine-rich repeat (LRR) protein
MTTNFCDGTVRRSYTSLNRSEASQALTFEFVAVMSKRERELGVLAGDLIALDLNGAGFQRVDFSQYNKLEVLLLRRNRLTTILNSGILGLKSLRVLDLRDNLIAEQSEIITLVRACHNLVSLGVSGNRFNSDPEERRAPLTSSRTNLSLSASTSSAPAAPPPSTRQKRHRHRLLKKLPELHERHCALRVLDDIEIQAREIIEAWKSTVGRSGKECTQNFRFKVLLLRNLPQDGDMATVTTLDLSGCELDFADLSSFASLQRLNLACNNISSLQSTSSHFTCLVLTMNYGRNQHREPYEAAGA